MTWFCLLVCKQAAVSSAVTVSITLGITLQRRSIAPLRAGFSVCSVPPAGHDYRGLKTHQFLSVNMEAGAAPSPAPRSCPPQTRALPRPAPSSRSRAEPSRARLCRRMRPRRPQQRHRSCGLPRGEEPQSPWALSRPYCPPSG